MPTYQKSRIKRLLSQLRRDNKLIEAVYNFVYKQNPNVCKNIRDWCLQSTDDQGKLIYESGSSTQIIERQMPFTIDNHIYPRFKEDCLYKAKNQYLTLIKGPVIIGGEGFLVLPNGSYSLEVAWDKCFLAENPGFWKRHYCPPKVKKGNYFSLIQVFCQSNYYHWMHDSLERLHKIKTILPSNIKYIVPSELKQWQYDSLNYFDISEDKICCLPDHEKWKLETLYFSPPAADYGCDDSEANKWLRDVVYDKLDIKKTSITKRIYISRSLARDRRITNESEVENCLNNYGFTTYRTETMTLEEQVYLFSQASVVISTHGAGLTNLIFAREGVKVLEITDSEILNHQTSTCYWSLCSSLNYEYWYLLGETRCNSPARPDIYVPINKLLTTLRRILV